MTRHAFPSRSAAVALAVLVAATWTLASVAPAGAAAVQQDDDPSLVQTIPRDQQVAGGAAELASGHVDLGPRFVDGAWRLLVHDTVTRPPVWRLPDDVVFRVGDAGRSEAPVDDRYAFLGVPAGAPVWVVPQTENPGVVWLGWNTQDPEVMERIDRGVRLRLLGADGPGKVSVYLQSGDLSGPEVLWESDAGVTDPLWVDVNTHTHANWVFSAPGPYVVRIEATADLLDGTTVTDTADVRIAVGDATPTADAAAASFGVEEAASSATPEDAAAVGPEDRGASSGASPALVALVGAAALVLAASVALGVARGRAARRRHIGGRTS